MSEVLRIGAFFDGTGNNKKNDLAIGDGSQTNVAKLYKLYEDKGYEAEYEEGVGTEAYKEGGATLSAETIVDIQNGTISKDSLYSYAMATGSTAKDHVESMLAKIADIIRDNPDKEIVIDVYGFSRGAAEARDFINEVNQLYTNIDGGSVVGFVGLFDSVASIGAPADYDWGLNLNLDENSAEQIFQITAEDEMRANFPLDSLAPLASTASNVAEVSLPGVHSDIGGGYGALDLEKTLVVEDTHRTETFFLDSDLDARIAELEAEVQALEAGQAGVDYELIYEVSPSVGVMSTYELESVIVEHHEIEYGLSNVALKTMYDQMTASGINLPALSSLGSVTFPVDNETYSLWQSPPEPYDVDDYIHISASDNWYGKTIKDWFVHREEWSFIDHTRDTYSNDSEEADIALLMLSDEDKTILYEQHPETYTIFGVTEALLSVLDNYSEQFAEHRAKFLSLQLNPLERFVPSDSGEISTLYSDFITGQEYRGSRLSDIDGVIFGSNEDDVISLDQEWYSFVTSGNRVVYGKDGNESIVQKPLFQTARLRLW